MKPVCRKRAIGLLLVFFVYMISLSAPFRSFASFPNELTVFSGQNKQLQLALPVNANVTIGNPDLVHVNGQDATSFRVKLNEPITLQTDGFGQTNMKLKVFGSIPLKTVKVNVIPDLKVFPGGQTIGVKLKSSGILVVGHHLVNVADNKKISPGEEAKIQMGDIITSMNGKALHDVSQVSEIVEQSGQKGEDLDLSILRGKESLSLKLNPAYDMNDKSYRMGLYIRDSAAGVGTLTFYAPQQGVYGALGHIITDLDTQTPIPVGSGEIVPSNVTSIAKSRNGEPGEKRANFIKENKVLGNITKNTPFGIFGNMFSAPDGGIQKEPIPVALVEEVKEGPAYIYTVLNGQKVERYDIEITHVAKQDFPATKGLVIKITDPKLLEKTGGIVQGMSGSPIVQNNKLVGAVTHVFVNDPSSGYGCFIEWMLQDAGITLRNHKEEQKAG